MKVLFEMEVVAGSEECVIPLITWSGTMKPCVNY